MNTIAEYRKKTGIKQRYLASVCGWKPNRLSMYETGKRMPGINDCRKIVRVLNQLGAECTLDDVFPPVGGIYPCRTSHGGCKRSEAPECYQ